MSTSGMGGEAYFFTGGVGNIVLISADWIHMLQPYATAKEILIRIALSEVSQMFSTFIILIVIIISITIITIIIAIIINSTKDDIWDMKELFYKMPNFGEQSSKPK